MTSLSVVSEVGPGDVRTFDLLRWAHPKEQVDPVDVSAQLFRSLSRRAGATSTLGSFLLDPDEEREAVACGQNDTHAWVAHRYSLPLRPGNDPLRSLIRSGSDVRRVMFTEQMEYGQWARWEGGRTVRLVRYGLDDDVARGSLPDFERPLWDGKLPKDPPPILVERPVEEHLDADELIAREPPEHLHVTEEGRFLLTFDPYWTDDEEGGGMERQPPHSFWRTDIKGEHVFLCLDTLNQELRWEESADPAPDVPQLVRAAVDAWFGLSWDLSEWDWPAEVYPIRRR